MRPVTADIVGCVHSLPFRPWFQPSSSRRQPSRSMTPSRTSFSQASAIDACAWCASGCSSSTLVEVLSRELRMPRPLYRIRSESRSNLTAQTSVPVCSK
eukprot:7384535-Prymnesium_polylepis.2